MQISRIAVATLAGLAAGWGSAPAQAADDPFTFETTAPLAPRPSHARHTPHYGVVKLGRSLRADEIGGHGATRSSTVPLWSHSVTDTDGSVYTATMVGKNPFIKQANPVSTISVYIIPVAVEFVDWGVTNDPTQRDAACSPAGTPLALTLASPLFTPVKLSDGGTAVGTGQITDLFQRANFWNYTKPGSTNPGYHVTLKPTVLMGNKVTYKVHGGPQPDNVDTDCGSEGFIRSEPWDAYVQNTLIPSLPKSVTTQTLPLFLFYNVTEYDNNDPSQCCTLGYHGAYTRGNQMQTYSISDYESSNYFGDSSQDVSTLTHEIGEWMDDPSGGNPTADWGNTGQVSGCQNNLEVGDPLSGSGTTATVKGMKYHLQDLAFYSWFYHQSPSIGVNGWFSFYGNFVTPAAACN